jgi:hypothetical protein
VTPGREKRAALGRLHGLPSRAIGTLIAEDVAPAVRNACRGRARQRADGAIHLGQQRHIHGRSAPEWARTGVRSTRVLQ